MEVTPETIDDATEGIAKLDNFAKRTARLLGDDVFADASVVDRFRDAMDDDFATPTALAAIFEAVRDGNVALDRGDEEAAACLAAAVIELTGALGLELRAGEDEVDPEAAAKAAARDEARAARDWVRADALRHELEALGWTVQDGPDGTRLTR
jgi:cysteinyl-tRNA synthetase